jgi:hypothetical protein
MAFANAIPDSVRNSTPSWCAMGIDTVGVGSEQDRPRATITCRTSPPIHKSPATTPWLRVRSFRVPRDSRDMGSPRKLRGAPACLCKTSIRGPLSDLDTTESNRSHKTQ